MNWSSVKNLLIAILVAANLFLIYNIVRQDRMRNYLKQETVDDAVQVLAERGLAVEDGCVPLKKFNAPVYESHYNDEYYTEVAEVLASSPRELLLSLPDGGFSITAQSGATVDFDSEFGFFYRSDDTFYDIAYTDISVESFGALAESGTELRGSLYKTLSERCTELLNARFAADGGLRAAVTDGFTDTKSGLHYLLARQTLDGYDVYSHYAVCVFRDGEIIGAYGRWFFFGFDKVHQAELADQVNILFADLAALRQDRAQMYSLADAENEAYDNGDAADTAKGDGLPMSTVCGMDACYITYWNAGKTALYFIPAWVVEHSDGQTLIYNATNSTMYLKVN